MSHIPYFAAVKLIRRFTTQINQAAENQRLSEGENLLLSAIVAQREIPSNLLIHVHSNPLLPGLTSLAITYTDSTRPAAYLCCPLQGIRPFDDFAALKTHTEEFSRQFSLPTHGTTWTALEGEVFGHWSQALVDQQTDALSQLNRDLARLPQLAEHVETQLAGELLKAFPTSSVAQLKAHRLHIINTSDNKVERVQSLIEACLEDLAGQSQGATQARRYLAMDGMPADAPDVERYQEALAAAGTTAKAAMAKALTTHWLEHAGTGGFNRRQQIALHMADGFARAVLRGLEDGSLEPGQAQALASLLSEEPGAQMNAFTLGCKDSGSLLTGVPLAGMLLLRSKGAASPLMFLFTPASGLVTLHTWAVLEKFVHDLTRGAERPEHVSLSNWASVQTFSTVHVEHYQALDAPFLALADTLIKFQQDNLTFRLGDHGPQVSTLLAEVDDALDLRGLLDPRLRTLDGHGRWLEQGGRELPPGLPVAPSRAGQPAGWRVQIDALMQRLHALHASQPTVADCVRRRLAPIVAVLCEGQLQPGDIYLRHANGTPDPAIRLTDWFLDRCSTWSVEPLREDDHLLDRDGKVLPWPSIAWVNRLITDHLEDFAKFYTGQMEDRCRNWVRLAKGSVHFPREMRALREASLRVEHALEVYAGETNADLLKLLLNALDYPSAALRAGLPGETADIHGMSLEVDTGKPVRLSNCLALHQHGQRDGKVLVWVCYESFFVFTLLDTLRTGFSRSISNEQERETWLSLLPPRQRMAARRRLDSPGVSGSLYLAAVTGDFIAEQCQREAERRRAVIGFSRDAVELSGFPHELYQRYLDNEARVDLLLPLLDRAQLNAQTLEFTDRLPEWLRNASGAQLEKLTQLLQRCVAVTGPQNDYLFDISGLYDFSRSLLSSKLMADYPGGPNDPDKIILTLTRYVVSPGGVGMVPSSIAAASFVETRTLTQAALDHMVTLQSATLRVSLRDAPAGVEPPTAEAVRAIIHQLDVAGRYRSLLADAFNPAGKDYARRRTLFCESFSVQMQVDALQQRLMNNFTDTAVAYVNALMQMPDALARPAVAGQAIGICQLKLRADPKLEPDPVLGIHIIGPDDRKAGPVLLFVAYDTSASLTEHDDEAALLAHLQKDTALQRLIVERVPREVKDRYNHNGLLHPHLLWYTEDMFDVNPEPAPATLVRDQEAGNALHHLFADNLKLLMHLAEARTVTTAEADWKAFCQLMSLGLEQGAQFLPLKLSVLVDTWQAETLFEDAAKAASHSSWGQALAEFVAGLATLASGRSTPHGDEPRGFRETQAAGAPVTKSGSGESLTEAPDELMPIEGEALAGNDRLQTPEQGAPAATSSASGWAPEPLPANLQDRLLQMVAQDIQLSDLRKDPALHLYQDAKTGAYYAPVRGRVFEVRQTDDAWTIYHNDERGPQIQRVQDEWQISPPNRLLGGGAAVSYAYHSRDTDASARTHFVTEASGMARMRRRFAGRYYMIQTAHGQAMRYLRQTLDNLNTTQPSTPLSPAVEGVLQDILGTPSTPPLLSALRTKCIDLFDELLKPSMDPRTSLRYVIGHNLLGYERTTAFTYPSDPQKRIFFTEAFFNLRTEVQVHALPEIPQAQLLTHQQAVTLIHELSHTRLDAVDLAYVEASVPFLDLIDQQSAASKGFVRAVKRARATELSVLTPSAYLFRAEEKGVFRDYETRDGRQKKTVLDITGAKTLADARIVFRSDADKRARVIMANADSMALIVSLIGRGDFPPAPGASGG